MKTQQQLQTEYMRAHIAERPLPGNRAIIEADAAATAQLVAGVYHQLDQVEAGVVPSTCQTVEQLQRWADLCQVPRKGAVSARRALALDVRGSDGAYVNPGEILTHGNREYRVTSQSVLAGGRGRCDLEAVEPGEAGKLARGASLRFRLAPENVAESATLVLDLSEGGWNEEPFGAWRERVAEVWATRGQGGNRTDYKQWCEELPFVEHAYVYGLKPTSGHVSVACTMPGSGSARALSPAQRAEVLAYLLDGRKPVCDQVHVLETMPTMVRGKVITQMYTDHAYTWTRPSAPVVVQRWDENLSRLVLDPVPDDLGVGDYLSVECIAGDASTSIGEPVIVTAAHDQVINVASAMPQGIVFGGYKPMPGDLVHPSNRTAYQVWRNIVYGYEQGTAFVPGLVHLGPANPDGRYGAWQADIQRARISASAIAVAGVRSAEVNITGVTDDYPSIEWPFPAHDRVALLVPGEWLVIP